MHIFPITAFAVIPEDERFLHVLERDWHNDVIDFVRYDVPKLLLIFIVAFAIQRVVMFFVNRLHALADSQVANARRAAQLRTMATVFRATSYFVLCFVVLLQVLPLFNIRPEPLLASAGVAAAAIAFGAQSIVKDMLNGIFILVEDQFNVGDQVKIAGLQGEVADMTLRMTTLRGDDGTAYLIPNSQIATVSNLSRQLSVASLTISVDASANPDEVLGLLRKLAAEVRNDAAFKDIVIADPDVPGTDVPGIDKINGREVVYPISIGVRADQKDRVLRELRRRILLVFNKANIPMGPATSTITMQHDPTAPPAQTPIVGS